MNFPTLFRRVSTSGRLAARTMSSKGKTGAPPTKKAEPPKKAPPLAPKKDAPKKKK